MSKSPPTKLKRHYIEVTPHTMHAVRTHGRNIEFWAECVLGEKTKAQKFVHEWTEGVPVSANVAVAPQPLFWHLGNREESRTLRSESDVQRFAAKFPHGFEAPLELIGCKADIGLPMSAKGSDAWLLGVTPGAALASAAADAIERGIVTTALGSSTLDCLATLTAVLKIDGRGTVRLWDIGRKQSHLFTVGVAGVEAVTTCPIGFESLFASVQQLLELKTPHDAAALLFGLPPADPELGNRLAATFKLQLETALHAAPGASGPVSFACTGLTQQQAWFGQHVAAALGLPYWSTNLDRYLNHLELRLPPSFPPETPSLAMLGALHLAAAPNQSTSAWHPTWGGISRRMANQESQEHRNALAKEIAEALSAPLMGLAPNEQTPPARLAPQVEPPFVPAARPPAVPARAPVTSGMVAAPLVERTEAKGPAYPEKITEVPEQIPEQPAPPVVSPAVPAPSAFVPLSPALPKTVPATHAPPVIPQRPKTPPPPEAKLPPKTEVAASPPRRHEPIVVVVRKRGYWLHVGMLLALIGAGVAWKFYLDLEASQAAADQARIAAANAIATAERDKTAAEERVRKATTEVEKANQRVRASAVANAATTTKLQQESEASRRAEIAQARRDAEEQTRRSMEAAMAATRAASAPGGLKITTAPAGAEVRVDGGPAQRTPVSIDNLAPGQHRVTITLAGHVPKQLTAEIVGSKVNDLGLVQLERGTGSVAITSQPQGVEFSIRAANTPADSNPLRRGQTPAQLEDLPTGNYVVQFRRAGWPERSERLTVEQGEKANVAASFQGGTVTITSDPVAQVSLNGLALGETPLTLKDAPPGETAYELNAAGYEPLKLTGTIVQGRELQLTGKLLGIDRLVSEAELRTPPRPYLTTPLQLGRIPRSAPAYVKVSFVVLRDGSLYDVAVIDKLDRKIQERAVEAIAKWKYYPGVSSAGYPVNVRITIPVKLRG